MEVRLDGAMTVFEASQKMQAAAAEFEMVVRRLENVLSSAVWDASQLVERIEKCTNDLTTSLQTTRS